MPRKYDADYKAMIVNLIVNEKHSTIKTAEQFDIPLKTLEKWITAYNKNNHVFDQNYLSSDQQIEILKNNMPFPGLICHSDKSSQFRSNDYRNFLKNNNFAFSYTNLDHSCDENAAQESF